MAGLSATALSRLRGASGGPGSLLGYGDWSKYTQGGGSLNALGGMSMSSLYQTFGRSDIDKLFGGGSAGGGGGGGGGAVVPPAGAGGGAGAPAEPAGGGAMDGLRRAVARGAGGAGLGGAAENERIFKPGDANPYLGQRLYPTPGSALTARGKVY